MEVQVSPETAKKLNDLAADSGRAREEIVEDALAGYFEELASLRKTLDSATTTSKAVAYNRSMARRYSGDCARRVSAAVQEDEWLRLPSRGV
jgi:hypothetical protein